MKQTNYILTIIFFLSINLLQAQEEKESKFNIIAYSGIGYGIIENDNEPNYNLNSNNADILLNYSINKNFGIATGIGMNKLSGNGFNSLGSFYHERTLLKIPLVGTMVHTISDKIKIVANFGVYTQNISNDDYQFLTHLEKDIYDGWNFGTQLELGFVFELSDRFSTGINYNGQSDFSKFKSNNNHVISDKTKLKSLNSLGIILIIKL